MSERIGFLTCFGPLMKTGMVPTPVLAMAVMRILDDLSKDHPRAMEAALQDMWNECSPAILEAVRKDPPAPKDVAAIVLAMYFGERGDWKAMERKLRATVITGLGIPGRTIDMIAASVTEVLRSAKAEAEKNTGKKTP